MEKINLSHIFLSILLILFQNTHAQNSECNLPLNTLGNIKTVDVEAVKCLAKNSKYPKTIFYCFAIWCSPCKEHLQDLITIKKKYDVDVKILLMEKEKHYFIQQAIDYLHSVDASLDIVLISDSYSKRSRKKYRKFLDEITPIKFKVYDGLSKYIVLNKLGKVEMVTNYKDYDKFNDDGPKMLQNLVIPLLAKKQI